MTTQLTEQQNLVRYIWQLEGTNSRWNMIDHADDDGEEDYESHNDRIGRAYEISELIDEYEAKYGPWEEAYKCFPNDDDQDDEDDEDATIDLVFVDDEDIPF